MRRGPYVRSPFTPGRREDAVHGFRAVQDHGPDPGRASAESRIVPAVRLGRHPGRAVGQHRPPPASDQHQGHQPGITLLCRGPAGRARYKFGQRSSRSRSATGERIVVCSNNFRSPNISLPVKSELRVEHRPERTVMDISCGLSTDHGQITLRQRTSFVAGSVVRTLTRGQCFVVDDVPLGCLLNSSASMSHAVGILVLKRRPTGKSTRFARVKVGHGVGAQQDGEATDRPAMRGRGYCLFSDRPFSV
jgi:hypothetical protein